MLEHVATLNEKERLSGMHVSLFVSIRVNSYLFEMLLLNRSLAVVCYKQTGLTQAQVTRSALELHYLR